MTLFIFRLFPSSEYLCRNYSKMHEKDERFKSHKDLDNEHDCLLVWCNINLQCGRGRKTEREKERKLLVPDPRMPNAFYTLTKNTGKDDL